MDSAMLQELEFLGTVIFYLIITLVVLSYITVILRLWVRYRITKSLGWDDAAMIATLLLFSSYCAFVLVITVRSQGDRTFEMQDIRVTLIYIQLSEVFYILTTTFLKISLGLFFLRVLTKKWQKIVFYIILAVGTIFGLYYVFIALFQCGNPTKIADSLVGSSDCLPEPLLLASGYIYGVINVLADWTFVLLPISVLVDSDLDRKSKISVSIVMALGAVGSVSSIMRMVYLNGLSLERGPLLSPESVKATIWATAEPGTGIIAASIAILRPLVRKIASDVRTKATPIKKVSQTDEEDSIALTTYAADDKGANIYDTAINDSVYNAPQYNTSRQNDQVYNAPRYNVPRRNLAEYSAPENWRVSSHSMREEDPWSPTIINTASVQRMVIVNGRMSPAPQHGGFF